MSVSLLQVPAMAVANGAGGGSGPTPTPSAGILEWVGGATSTVAYAVGDAVLYNESGFVCITAQPIGSPPPAWSTGGAAGPWGPFSCDALENIAGTAGVVVGGAGSSTGETVPAIALYTPTSAITMDTINAAGELGQVSIVGNGTAPTPAAPGRITVGGTVNNTGLYVGNTAVLFNGVALEASTGTYMLYLGAWAAGTTYAINTVVISQSAAWVSLQNANTGNTPAYPSTAFWQPLAPQAGGGNLPSGAVNAIGMNAAAQFVWQGDGATPPASTIAYDAGSIVNYAVDGSWYMLSVDQAVGTADPNANPNWINLSGSIIANAEAELNTSLVACTSSGVLISNDDAGVAVPAPGQIQVGGDVVNTGLYVSNTALLFNGAAVGGGGVQNTISTPAGAATNASVACSVSGVLLQSDDAAAVAPAPGQIQIGGPTTGSGLYVSDTQLLFNGSAIGGGVVNPVTVPNSGPPNQNAWVLGDAYNVGAVVYASNPPYNWFICYAAVPVGTETDPQTDVNAGTFGQGTYWQLLSPSSFTTTTGTTPGAYFGNLTLSGTAITSTNLATGEVVIDAGGGTPASISGGSGGNVGTVSCDTNNGNVSISTTGGAGVNIKSNVNSHFKVFANSGNIEIGCTDPAGSLNQLNIVSVLPTGSSSPSDGEITLTSAGKMTFSSQGDKTFTTDLGSITMSAHSLYSITSVTNGINFQTVSSAAGAVVINPNQGDTNAQSGNVMYFCGPFEPGKNYAPGAVVTHLGNSSWVAMLYNIGSTTPPATGINWTQLF